MVIRTITCHHAFNHGAMLQAYALLTYLQSLGHDARAIDYRPWYMPPVKVYFNYVDKRFNYPIIRQLYRFYHKRAWLFEQERRSVLERFFVSSIPTTSEQYRSAKKLKDNPPVADIYIAGSDQIWNTTFENGNDPAFYLNFGSPKRKISYAASFATMSLKLGTEQFVKEQLKNFDAISIREESGKKILESLGYRGDLVLDPVFLLDKDFWIDFAKKEDTGSIEEYVLTYDFEHRKSSVKRIAKRLAALYGYKIYSVSPSRSHHEYADQSFACCSPEKFVSLIKNAKCVVSNSFHGTAFSIILEKNFFVVNRKDGLNIRMIDLLNRYDLNDRLVNPETSDELLSKDVNYSLMRSRLGRDADVSRSFLLHQIELAR